MTTVETPTKNRLEKFQQYSTLSRYLKILSAGNISYWATAEKVAKLPIGQVACFETKEVH